MFMDHANPVLWMKNKINAIKNHMNATVMKISEMSLLANKAHTRNVTAIIIKTTVISA
jgi:hypothetical protein